MSESLARLATACKTVENIKTELVKQISYDVRTNHFSILSESAKYYIENYDKYNSAGPNNKMYTLDVDNNNSLIVLVDTGMSLKPLQSFGNSFSGRDCRFYNISPSDYLDMKISWYVDRIVSSILNTEQYVDNVYSIIDRAQLTSITMEYIYNHYNQQDIDTEMRKYGWELHVQENNITSGVRSYKEGPIVHHEKKINYWYLAPSIAINRV